MLWIRMALGELMKNKGFSLFFIVNLSIGLAGFIAIQCFGRSLNRHLDENLKEILTADLVLSSNSPMTLEELNLVDKVLGPDKTGSRLVSFYSMVRAGDQARLVRVMAIDEFYPLYGGFTFEGPSHHSHQRDIRDIQKSPGLFMTQDTALALGINNRQDLNKPLILGNKTFYVQDFFKDDPDRSLTSLELAPKIYMGMDQLKGTGLIRFGSRIKYLQYYRFSGKTNIPELVFNLRQALYAQSDQFGQPGQLQGQPRINVYDTRDVNQRLGRVTGYFTGYMGLVSIVALFLAGIATAYLFQGFLNLKLKEIAILMSIGARHRAIYFYISFQLILLGTLAAILALAISILLFPAFPVIFKDLIPSNIPIVLDPVTIVLALAMGMAGSFIFCLPVFVRIFSIKPLVLLQGQGIQGRGRGKPGPVSDPVSDPGPAVSVPVSVPVSGPGQGRVSLPGNGQGLGNANGLVQTASFLPGLAGFFLVSVLVAGSVRTGIIFAVGFIVSMVFLSGVGWLIFSGCRYLSATRNLPGKIAFRNLFRNKWSSLSCFVTIAMGVFLISIIPQVQKGLQTEIMRPEGLKIPVFFLVDIQEEQKLPFIEFMKNQDGDLSNISPMVRGRILFVNQKPFYGKNQDQDTSPRGRDSGRGHGRRLEFNFSHRKTLDASEIIVQGRPLSPIPWNFEASTPFEVSLEQSFAERMGISLGDLMGFDIQGIPMEGRVVNLRKVRWNSFQPNFFLLFQDGVLDNAPKTFLASVSSVPKASRQDLKNQIVRAFPNISVIDVTQMAGTLLTIIEKLSLSIGFMAWLAIAAGLVSIFSIARHEARKNENQVNLLKVLGADFKTIQAITLLEFGFIGFFAALSALVLSSGFSRAVSWYFFDSLWQFDLGYSFVILFATTGICMGTAFTASRKVLNSKPVRLLANT
jgi:putative ABC transport system permease protein